MSFYSQLVPQEVKNHLSTTEENYLDDVFNRFGGRYPSLEELWQLMDEPWLEMNFDPNKMDDRVSSIYKHPVWLLNGLFIEQHPQSMSNRQRFTEWIVAQAPRRVADYGGGFGGLARMIGAACPAATVEVIEPHPHPAGTRRSLRQRPT